MEEGREMRKEEGRGNGKKKKELVKSSEQMMKNLFVSVGAGEMETGVAADVCCIDW